MSEDAAPRRYRSGHARSRDGHSGAARSHERAAVTRNLLATNVEDGLIGDVRFDERGDVRPRTYSVARLTPQSATVPGVVPVEDLEAIISPE
jgi:hypothetical protein